MSQEPTRRRSRNHTRLTLGSFGLAITGCAAYATASMVGYDEGPVGADYVINGLTVWVIASIILAIFSAPLVFIIAKGGCRLEQAWARFLNSILLYEAQFGALMWLLSITQLIRFHHGIYEAPLLPPSTVLERLAEAVNRWPVNHLLGELFFTALALGVLGSIVSLLHNHLKPRERPRLSRQKAISFELP